MVISLLLTFKVWRGDWRGRLGWMWGSLSAFTSGAGGSQIHSRRRQSHKGHTSNSIYPEGYSSTRTRDYLLPFLGSSLVTWDDEEAASADGADSASAGLDSFGDQIFIDILCSEESGMENLYLEILDATFRMGLGKWEGGDGEIVVRIFDESGNPMDFLGSGESVVGNAERRGDGVVIISDEQGRLPEEYASKNKGRENNVVRYVKYRPPPSSSSSRNVDALGKAKASKPYPIPYSASLLGLSSSLQDQFERDIKSSMASVNLPPQTNTECSFLRPSLEPKNTHHFPSRLWSTFICSVSLTFLDYAECTAAVQSLPMESDCVADPSGIGNVTATIYREEVNIGWREAGRMLDRYERTMGDIGPTNHGRDDQNEGPPDGKSNSGRNDSNDDGSKTNANNKSNKKQSLVNTALDRALLGLFSPVPTPSSPSSTSSDLRFQTGPRIYERGFREVLSSILSPRPPTDSNHFSQGWWGFALGGGSPGESSWSTLSMTSPGAAAYTSSQQAISSQQLWEMSDGSLSVLFDGTASVLLDELKSHVTTTPRKGIQSLLPTDRTVGGAASWEQVSANGAYDIIVTVCDPLSGKSRGWDIVWNGGPNGVGILCVPDRVLEKKKGTETSTSPGATSTDWTHNLVAREMQDNGFAILCPPLEHVLPDDDGKLADEVWRCVKEGIEELRVDERYKMKAAMVRYSMEDARRNTEGIREFVDDVRVRIFGERKERRRRRAGGAGEGKRWWHLVYWWITSIWRGGGSGINVFGFEKDSTLKGEADVYLALTLGFAIAVQIVTSVMTVAMSGIKRNWRRVKRIFPQ